MEANRNDNIAKMKDAFEDDWKKEFEVMYMKSCVFIALICFTAEFVVSFRIPCWNVLSRNIYT